MKSKRKLLLKSIDLFCICILILLTYFSFVVENIEADTRIKRLSFVKLPPVCKKDCTKYFNNLKNFGSGWKSTKNLRELKTTFTKHYLLLKKLSSLRGENTDDEDPVISNLLPEQNAVVSADKFLISGRITDNDELSKVYILIGGRVFWKSITSNSLDFVANVNLNSKFTKLTFYVIVSDKSGNFSAPQRRNVTMQVKDSKTPTPTPSIKNTPTVDTTPPPVSTSIPGAPLPGPALTPVSPLPPVSTDSAFCTLDIRPEAGISGDKMAHDDSMNATIHSEHVFALEKLVPITLANVSATKNNGLWSDGATWNTGKVPTNGDNVRIPEGITVVYDVTDNAPKLNTVRVDGRLLFHSCKSSLMRVDTLLSTGVIRAGWTDSPQPIYTNVTIEFTNSPINTSLDPSQFGKGWLAYGPSYIYGMPRSPFVSTITKLSPGATSIQVNGELANWSVNDELLVVGTNPRKDESEVRKISKIASLGNNSFSITFDQALQYTHTNSDDRFPYHIANLTRNVTFVSEDKNKPLTQSQTWGHVMFMHNPSASINYASFDSLGRTRKFELLDDTTKDDKGTVTHVGTNVRGRYALHFHRTGNSPGSLAGYVEGSVVRNSPSWGISNHSSNLISVANITYHVLGAGYMTETSTELGFAGKGGRYNAESMYISTYGSKDYLGVENGDRANRNDFGVEGFGLWAGAPLVVYDGNIISTSAITYPTSIDSSTFKGTTDKQGGLWVGSVTFNESGIGLTTIPVGDIPDKLKFVALGKSTAHPKTIPYQNLRNTYIYSTNKIAQIWAIRSFFLAEEGVVFNENAWTSIENLKVVNFVPHEVEIRIDYSSQIEFNKLHLVQIEEGFSEAITRNQVTHSIRVVGTKEEPSIFENMWGGVDAPYNGEFTVRNLVGINLEYPVLLETRGQEYYYDFETKTIKKGWWYQKPLIENLTIQKRGTSRLWNSDFDSERFDPSNFGETPVIEVIRNGTRLRAYPPEQIPSFIPYPSNKNIEAVPAEFKGKTNLELFQTYGAGIGGYIPPSVTADKDFSYITPYVPRRDEWVNATADHTDSPNYTQVFIRAKDNLSLNGAFTLKPGWNILKINGPDRVLTHLVWYRTADYKIVKCNCPYDIPGWVNKNFSQVGIGFDDGSGLNIQTKQYFWYAQERAKFPVVNGMRIYPIDAQFPGDTRATHLEFKMPVSEENNS